MNDEDRRHGVAWTPRDGQLPPRVPLLDRLLRAGSEAGRFGVRELLGALVRDVECLLNARLVIGQQIGSLPCARVSLLGFGLRDFSQTAWTGAEGLHALIREIEQAIRAFEPRLDPGTVRVEPDARPGDGMLLQLRVQAVLQVESVRERIALATAVDLQRGCIDVRGIAP